MEWKVEHCKCEEERKYPDEPCGYCQDGTIEPIG